MLSPRRRVEEREQRLARVHVDAREGLVEQQDVRLLGERPGEEHALLLAAGELADGALLELGDAELVQAARHHLAVGGPGRRNQPRRPYRPIITTSCTVTGKLQSISSRWGTYAIVSP